MWSRAPSFSSAFGARVSRASSTASSRRHTSCGAPSRNPAGSKPYVGSGTGSSSRPELPAALHRLRSTLARLKAELELAMADGDGPPMERLLDDVREALSQLEAVEDASQLRGAVLVVDDDERLGEITARGLRRLGFNADSSSKLSALPAREVLVFDLSVLEALDARSHRDLKASRPIVVTGATD